MRAGDVEAHSANGRHEQNTGIVRSGIMEPFEDQVTLLHAVMPVEEVHLDSGIAKDLECEGLWREYAYRILNLTFRMTSLFEGNAE